MLFAKPCRAFIVAALLALALTGSALTALARRVIDRAVAPSTAGHVGQQADARIKQLAENLTAATTEDKRQALLGADRELVTAELVSELIASTDRLRLRGDYELSLNLFRFTQSVAEQIGDQVGVARAVQGIGSVYQGRGEYETASEYYRKSLPLSEAAKYQRGVSAFFVNMGLNYRLQGDFDKALEFYRQGLKMNEAAGDKRDIAVTLNLIGVVHRLQGNGRLALLYSQKSLALFEETGFQPGVTGMLNNIGNIYVQQGQFELAEESYRRSLALAEQERNRLQVSQALNNVGRARRHLGDYAKALEFFRQSLSLREEAGDKVGIPRTLQNIAETYSVMGDYQRALEYYQQSLALHESLGSKSDIASTMVSIGLLYLSRGDFKASLEWSQRAGRSARELNRLELLWQALTTVGAAHRALKQYPQALGELYGPTRSRVYVGPAAREERVKAEAGDYHILQLATHGVLNDASPMYSHVLLAQEDGNVAEDGLLEAWELMNLSLNADLVVLSACETARGRVGAGEGVIGLSWALFVAGSPVTVVSQWKVESASTTELMLEFHRNLLGKSGKAGARMSTTNALQGAAKKLLASREYRHPFYWAGFVVVGDGR